jgi:hypothetical protein
MYNKNVTRKDVQESHTHRCTRMAWMRMMRNAGMMMMMMFID